MIKYAKVINNETGLCEVGLGTNNSFYSSIGMTMLNVAQSDIDGGWYLAEKCPMKTEDEKAIEKRQRLDLLSLTKREVFLALFKDKGITPEQLKSQITNPEALIEFEYANDYFRGNPLINQIGALLGYTADDLDYLFKNKKLPIKEEGEAQNA